MPSNGDKFKTSLQKASRKFDRIRIEKRGNRLSLQATLPPKPGEVKPRQRYIPTGKPANPAGLKLALAMAMRLEAELIEGSFDWLDWDPKLAQAAKPKSAATWAAELVESKRQQVVAQTLRVNYTAPLSHLPGNVELTEELCRRVIEERTQPRSRNRQRYVSTYTQLCKFADIPANLRTLLPAGGVKSQPIDPRALPSDEAILEAWQGIKKPAYKILYARMAIYGLRPHEAFKSTVTHDQNKPICEVWPDTKTGPRIVVPWPFEWYELMQPWQDFEPYLQVSPSSWRTRTNWELGRRLSAWSGRNLDFIPYYLRHAYAIRLAKENVSVDNAARWMGHSVSVHVKEYQRAIGVQADLQAWRNARGQE